MERIETYRCVVVASGVVLERKDTVSGIVRARGIELESPRCGCRVVGAYCVRCEGFPPMAVLNLAVVLLESA